MASFHTHAHDDESSLSGTALSDKAGEKRAVKDPVCGMDVDPATAKHKADYEGAPYFFCSVGCREKFVAQPQRYMKQKPLPAHADIGAGTIYTCPMHPQIRQAGPGNCPICGMALEPETPVVETGPSAELIDMTRRFWIGLVLAIPVFVLEMGAHVLNLHWLPQQTSNWVQFALATPVVVWAGWPFFERGWQSLVSRNLNMFTLIAMGTGVAVQRCRNLCASTLPTRLSQSRRISSHLF